jgi:hypothetical protein
MSANTRGPRMQGEVIQWPWSDRGRSVITEKMVRDDLEKLAREFRMHLAVSGGLVRF